MSETYRVGNHQAQNVYRGEQYIGVMFTAEDAATVVEALNGRPVGNPRGYHPTCVEITNPAVDVERKFMCGAQCPPPPIVHRAEMPGSDGLGYGKCTGCGELWPCNDHRRGQ